MGWSLASYSIRGGLYRGGHVELSSAQSEDSDLRRLHWVNLLNSGASMASIKLSKSDTDELG